MPIKPRPAENSKAPRGGAAGAALLRGPLLVGTVHDEASCRAALRLRPGRPPDWLELRLDGHQPAAGAWERLAAGTRPLLVTARHPAEGGWGNLSSRERQGLLLDALARPGVAAVDVELRSARALAGVAAAARAARKAVLFSWHDFERTPPTAALRRRARRAEALGADGFKVATRADDAASVARLLAFLGAPGTRGGLRIAAMGMGRMGRISRLLLAMAGSALNYAALGAAHANAPGQWPADLFARRLREVAAE